MKNPKKILIANRGVIAIRALRAAKELGYQVASVYSTIDKDQTIPIDALLCDADKARLVATNPVRVGQGK